MRCFTVRLLPLLMAGFFVSLSLAQTLGYHPGQGARYVIGQPRFDAQETVPIDFSTQEWKANRELLGAAGGVAFVDGKLFVAEGNRVAAEPSNHRVGIYTVADFLPEPTARFPEDDPRRCRVCGGVPDVVLGQPDFETRDFNLTQAGMRQPTYVHSDGQRVVVADTENNRVLIWNSIPTTNGAPADVVLGQENFTSGGTALTPTASRLRAPQGVWIQGSRLFVADTLFHRILIWNSIPTSNAQAPDVVLGQPNFTTTRPSDLLEDDIPVSASNLLSPVGVTSDGTRLIVADLGHSRVLIWNAIPTQNNQPADIVIGQPDLTSPTSRFSNNTTRLCEQEGVDANDNPLYPPRCGYTLSLPRFALSDGQRLFIADSGNDRVLVYNDIPVSNAPKADVVLGQPDEFRNIVSDDRPIFGEDINEQLRSAVDILRTPLSLATDGFNLFIPDAFNRRVLVYSPGDLKVPSTAVRNAASLIVNAIGTIEFDGTLREDEEVGIRIGREIINIEGRRVIVDEITYKFKAPEENAFGELIQGLVDQINADDGDPLVLATANLPANSVVLTAREGGAGGDDITMAVERATDSILIAETSSAKLRGGRDAAKIGIGSLVSVFGQRMADQTAVADMEADTLPRQLGGVELICDGHSVPLMYVSETQINAQMPFEFEDSFSASCYVRTEYADGRVESSVTIAVPLIAQNPGIFSFFGPEPRPAVAFHGSSRASALIFIDGPAVIGDVVRLTIQEDRVYEYTVTDEDFVRLDDDPETRSLAEINATNRNIRAKLIELINEDPEVEAFPAPFFTRILLLAREEGPQVNGTIRVETDQQTGAQVLLNQSRTSLGGANVAGALISEDNPIEAGSLFVVYATGLGRIRDAEDNQLLQTGKKYTGSTFHELAEQLDSLAGGRTANLISAVAKPGTFGLYEITLEANSGVGTDPLSQLTVFQSWYVSNIAAVPIQALPGDDDDDDEENGNGNGD
jgi:hypothetical protein